MRPIDADELLARMRERCDSCPHNGNREHCLTMCDWREAIDEVEDSPEIEASVTASNNGVAIGMVRGGLVIQRAKEITNIKDVGVFYG